MADTTTLSDTDLALRLARALGWEIDEPSERVRIPNYGSTYAAWFCRSGDIMLRVLDAMRERGIWLKVETCMDDDYEVSLYHGDYKTTIELRGLASAPTLPRAVAEAALSALESA